MHMILTNKTYITMKAIVMCLDYEVFTYNNLSGAPVPNGEISYFCTKSYAKKNLASTDEQTSFVPIGNTSVHGLL